MSILKVIGPRDKFYGEYINTTSHSTNWSKELSPFYLGPIDLYSNYKALNMENAWQFSKVYKEHVDLAQNIIHEYYDWAIKGWNSKFAYRYPMGKGTIPLYSLWNNEKLDYIEARKKIYLPLYARAVVKTKAFSILKDKYDNDEDIVLWDFDGYDHGKLNMTIDDVLNCQSKKMGHAFVLYMLLSGKVSVKNDIVIINI